VADDFSERFRVALARQLPDLARHLRPVENGALELRLLAPSGHGELVVLTYGEEVTIGFGPWHAHFEEQEWWADDQSPRSAPSSARSACWPTSCGTWLSSVSGPGRVSMLRPGRTIGGTPPIPAARRAWGITTRRFPGQAGAIYRRHP
jgi:hypothetical protein